MSATRSVREVRRITLKDKRLIVSSPSRSAIWLCDNERSGVLFTYGALLKASMRSVLEMLGWRGIGALVVDSGGHAFSTGTFRSVPSIREYHELAKALDPDIVFTFDPHDFGADPAVVMSRFLKYYKEQADYWAADGAPYLLYAVVHAHDAYSVSHELQMLREFAKYVESVHGRELDGIGIAPSYTKSLATRFYLFRKVIEFMPDARLHLLICDDFYKMLLMNVINIQSGDTAFFKYANQFGTVLYRAMLQRGFSYSALYECYEDRSVAPHYSNPAICAALKEFERAISTDWVDAVEMMLPIVASKGGHSAVEEFRQLVRTVQAVGRV